MNTPRFFAIGFLVLVGGLFFLFQNCSKVSLQKRQELSMAPPPSAMHGSVCSLQGPGISTPLKLLFVVDMSASNIGGDLHYDAGGPGTDTWRWTTGKFFRDMAIDGKYYPNFIGYSLNGWSGGMDPKDFAKTLAVTDGDGLRFQAVKAFSSASSACSNLGASVSYSVIGFSTGALMPHNSGATCDSSYLDSTTDFTTQVDELKFYQDLDLDTDGNPYYAVRAGGSQSPYQMEFTNYMEALSCMDSKVNTDALLHSDDVPYYYTVFLSDGRPGPGAESPCPCTYFGFTSPVCSQYYTPDPACLAKWGITDCWDGTKFDESCVNSRVIPKKLQLIKDSVEPYSSGFKFQPVFYWPSDMPGSEYDSALQVMTPLAQVGGVPSVIHLTDSSQMQNLQNVVCSSIQTSMNVQYDFSSIMAVNLNARMDKGVLKADSDADGLTDDGEGIYSMNPLQSRTTNGVLDVLCAKNKKICSQVTSCNSTQAVGFGFNDCDRQFVKLLTGNTMTGIADNDNGILDFVELIKGGNPFANGGSVYDGDGTGLPLATKIAVGYDLNSDEKVFPPQPHDLMQADFRLSPESACASGQTTMNISIVQSPYVQTKAFKDFRTDKLSLSHDEGVNLILIHYSIKPTGPTQNTAARHFVALIPLGPDGIPPKTLSNSDFIEIGGGP